MKEEAAVFASLAVSAQSSRVQSLIADSLQLLLEKRATLEEKMIRRYFMDLAIAQNKICGQLFNCIRDETGAEKISSETIQALSETNQAILQALEAFLKAARYDLNYLEQYFEHGFYQELENSNFKETICGLALKIQDSELPL